jgi:NADPH oxidase 5
LRESRPPSSLDRELLGILERAFSAHAGADAVIDLNDLRAALGVQNDYFAKRVLHVLDVNRDGVIKRDEFLAGVRALVAGTDRERLEFAFRLHDHDGDGTLDREEILRMIMVSLAESATSQRVMQPAESLVNELLREADRDRDGKLTFEELETHVAKRPHLLRSMVRSEAIWIAPNEELLRWLDRGSIDVERAASGSERVFLAIWLVANAILVTAFFLPGLRAGENPIMRLGRALGVGIAFNGALILVPMMRRLMSKLRATWLGRVFPIDEAVDFHRLVGHALFGLSLVHGACFLFIYGDAHRGGPMRLIFENQRGLTGVLLTAVFLLMWICSLSFVRRTHRFEFFYFTHLLYVAWLGLAIAHAPSVLFWIGVPLLGFVIEQILRLFRRRRTTITTTHALRSGVTRLELAKPEGFDAQPGDYAYLRIPSIARFEWHPFTISSAPERPYLTFHVRSLGNWTSALRTFVEERDEPSSLSASIDGPYGTPSAHIFAARYAVLIGAGIGVTPFASVLESLVLRGNGSSSRPSKLRHAHFFWLNKDHYAFEWFVALLKELEKNDHAAMLDVHLCISTVRAGATSLGLELARDAMHAAGGNDVFTGLRTHTHLGPPDWEHLLGNIVKQHAPEKVDVFFCGPPALGLKLKPICQRLGMSFREERF